MSFSHGVTSDLSLGTAALVLGLLGAVLAVPALAADVPEVGLGAPATPAVACGPLHWKLDGASESASRGADFSPAWGPVLAEIAACGKHLALTTGCLIVRGHYDTVEFKGAQDVVGGQKNAQRLRAASRAERVARELRALGVTEDVLRWSPTAYDFPTYRGASIDLEPSCRPNAVQELAQEVARQLRLAIPASAAEPEPAAAPEPPIDAAPVPAPAPDPGPAPALDATALAPPPRSAPSESPPWTPWLEATLAVDSIHASGGWQLERAFVPELHLGGGVAYRSVYARANLSLQTGVAPEQRLGMGGLLGVGYSHSALLNGGLVASYQVSTAYLGDPVLDRYWAVALEAHQCLLELAAFELCAREALELLANYEQRADVTDGRVEVIPPVRSWARGLSIGISLRRGL